MLLTEECSDLCSKLFVVEPRVDLSAYDAGLVEDLDDRFGGVLRHVKGGIPLVDLYPADEFTGNTRLVGHCADDVLGEKSRAAAEIDVNFG